MALSVFAEVLPYSREVVKSGSFPDSVNAQALLKDRSATLQRFCTTSSKTAPCISCSEVSASFWRNVENNNRSTERMIGKMKRVVQNKLMDVHRSLTRLIYVSELISSTLLEL